MPRSRKLLLVAMVLDAVAILVLALSTGSGGLEMLELRFVLAILLYICFAPLFLGFTFLYDPGEHFST